MLHNGSGHTSSSGNKHGLDNPDPKVFGPTKEENETRQLELIQYLNALVGSNDIKTLPKETAVVNKWFNDNVSSALGAYDNKNPAINSAYKKLLTQARAHLAQNAGGSKRRKSTRIFRKSIRKCKKCKRNYRKSKKSKQA